MRIPFRQGLIDYQTNGFGQPQYLAPSSTPGYIDLIVSPTPCSVAFAHGSSDYLQVFASGVAAAWGPIPPAVTSYLYWDIDLLTSNVTFGLTTLEPVAATTAPVSPPSPNGLAVFHWFDMSTSTMKVWKGNRWQNVVRVFAGRANGTPSSITSEPRGQSWLNSLPVEGRPGYISTDVFGNPIRMLSGEFVTTATPVRFRNTVGTTGVLAVLPNAYVPVRASENIPAMSLVYFSGAGTVGLASGNPAVVPPRIPIGVVQNQLAINEVGTVTQSGEISYDQWDWSAHIGKPLYCGNAGEIVTTRPAGLLAYRIGFVKNSKTILFQVDAETLPQVYQADVNDIVIAGDPPIETSFIVNQQNERVWTVSMPVVTVSSPGYMTGAQLTQLVSHETRLDVAEADILGKADLVHAHVIADVDNLQLELDGKADLVHTHVIADVDNLQLELDGKADLVHTHVIDDVTSLQAELDARIDKVPTATVGNFARFVTGGGVEDSLFDASSFAFANHTHSISNVTGLQSALDGKSNTGHTHVAADVTDFADALDAAIVAGTGVSKNYDSMAGTIELSMAEAVSEGSHLIYVDRRRTDTYVEDGSAERPFKTIAAAIAAAEANGDGPTTPYSFLIGEGSYPETIDLNNLGLFDINIIGLGRVAIDPTSGNALTCTSGNSQLRNLTIRYVEFADPVVITGNSTVNQFTNVTFYNVALGTLTATCMNSLNVRRAYISGPVTLSNVAWGYWQDIQQDGPSISITSDTTATQPAWGMASAGMFFVSSRLRDFALTRTGTGNFNLNFNHCFGGVGTNAYTVPTGFTVNFRNSTFAGSWTNSGTINSYSSTLINEVIGTAISYPGITGAAKIVSPTLAYAGSTLQVDGLGAIELKAKDGNAGEGAAIDIVAGIGDGDVGGKVTISGGDSPLSDAGGVELRAGETTTAGADGGSIAIYGGVNTANGANSGSVMFHTDGVERLRISGDGALWVDGQHGQPGDVLTSNGAGVPPAWAPPAGGGGGVDDYVFGFSAKATDFFSGDIIDFTEQIRIDSGTGTDVALNQDLLSFSNTGLYALDVVTYVFIENPEAQSSSENYWPDPTTYGMFLSEADPQINFISSDKSYHYASADTFSLFNSSASEPASARTWTDTFLLDVTDATVARTLKPIVYSGGYQSSTGYIGTVKTIFRIRRLADSGVDIPDPEIQHIFRLLENDEFSHEAAYLAEDAGALRLAAVFDTQLKANSVTLSSLFFNAVDLVNGAHVSAFADDYVTSSTTRFSEFVYNQSSTGSPFVGAILRAAAGGDEDSRIGGSTDSVVWYEDGQVINGDGTELDPPAAQREYQVGDVLCVMLTNSGATGTVRLFRNGVLVATYSGVAVATFMVPAVGLSHSPGA